MAAAAAAPLLPLRFRLCSPALAFAVGFRSPAPRAACICTDEESHTLPLSHPVTSPQKKDKKEKKDREKDKEKKGAVSESQFGRFGARTQNPPPPPCAEPRSSCFHFPCPRTTGYTDARLFPARDLRRHCPPAGIIRETDINEKRAEFCSWLTEVKGLNPEALAKWEEKDHFKVRSGGQPAACCCCSRQRCETRAATREKRGTQVCGGAARH